MDSPFDSVIEPGMVARPRASEDAPDRPEVPGEVGVQDVVEGEREVAVEPPATPPGVPREEPAAPPVVADRDDGVPAERPLPARGHRHAPRLADAAALEALVDGEA